MLRSTLRRAGGPGKPSALQALAAEGFVHYEISNYARPGAESLHNLGYWRGADDPGLGCAAFGTLGTGSGAAVRHTNDGTAAELF
jgi:coproporphyrinogen III oxidase-like Fe-S oxidoreductase